MSLNDTPEFDTRPTIRLANTIMESPKIVGLSDKAFRAYIALICYCSRQETNGKVVAGAARMLATPKALGELADAKLLETEGKDYWVHDYLKHQRSSAEVAAYRESRAADGKRGAHLRWHVPRRIKSKDCEFCLSEVPSA